MFKDKKIDNLRRRKKAWRATADINRLPCSNSIGIGINLNFFYDGREIGISEIVALSLSILLCNAKKVAVIAFVFAERDMNIERRNHDF